MQKEDECTVSYVPDLLLAWRGHLNVQKVTRTGLERYLVKYMTKIEPTFGLTVSADQLSESGMYHNTRLIGSPEFIMNLLLYHVVNSTRNVVFLDTNQSGNRRCLLKPLSCLTDLDKSSGDIFMASIRDKYRERPLELENLTLLQYANQWEVFTRKQNILKSRSHEVYLDQK